VFKDDFSDKVTNSLINYLLSDCNSSEHYVGWGSGIPIYHHFYKSSKLIADYIDGKYSLSLPPGKYIVMVAYPDGTNKKVTNF
jgi:hypothetical protein